MNICYDCDIAFNEKDCPLCKVKEQLESVEDELAVAEERIKELEKGE